jgi:hypothetical protein
MSTGTSQDFGDLSDGVVQLRFSDEGNTLTDINAAEFAEVLQGLVEFTSDMYKTGMFGDGLVPTVRVRPPVEGSFIIEAIIQYASTNPIETITGAMSAGGGIVMALNVAVKKLRGFEPADIEHLDNGNVKVIWANGGVDEIPDAAWKDLNAEKRKTRKTLRKIMAPLGDDVAQLEVRTGSVEDSTEDLLQAAPAVVMGLPDYSAAATEVNEESETVSNFEAEAQLRSIDFRPGEKWHIQTLHGTRQATMEDEDFLLQLDRGMALHKNDIFNVMIRETKTTKNGRTTKAWSLTQVTLKRRGDDDGDDELASEEQAPSAA